MSSCSPLKLRHVPQPPRLVQIGVLRIDRCRSFICKVAAQASSSWANSVNFPSLIGVSLVTTSCSFPRTIYSYIKVPFLTSVKVPDSLKLCCAWIVLLINSNKVNKGIYSIFFIVVLLFIYRTFSALIPIIIACFCDGLYFEHCSF